MTDPKPELDNWFLVDLLEQRIHDECQAITEQHRTRLRRCVLGRLMLRLFDPLTREQE